MLLQRRHFLALLGAGLSSSVIVRALGKPGKSADFDQLDLHLPGDPAIAQRALVMVPKHLDPDKPHPAVVLLHGYGQAKHELTAIHAWRDDYGAIRDSKRLRHPPIKRLYNTVRYLDDGRIKVLNKSLSREPFRGLVMICPVVPIPYFSHDSRQLLSDYTRWIADTLLPTVRKHAPVTTDPAQLGLAGHSMGGHVAIEVFLRRPDLFGALTAIQPELQKNAGWRYGRQLANRMQQLGAKPLQLLTSTRDPYRREVHGLHTELARRGVAHQFRSAFGPHTSNWMREIGTLETLLWQDRALRGRLDIPWEPPGKPDKGGTAQRIA